MEGSAAVTLNGAGHLPGLLYSEEENDLRASVRALLEDRCGWQAVLVRTETGEPYDTGLWRALAAELGCAGLLIPPEHGGAGGSYREACVVAEELGQYVAPVPYLGSSVVATAALLAAGDTGMLARLAPGDVTAALAVPFASMPGGPVAAAARLARPRPGDLDRGVARLSGTVRGVADALPADALLVPADGVPFGLYEVDATAAGVTRTALVSLDMTRQLCDVSLHEVPARVIASGEAAERAVQAALAAGAVVLASEQLGLAERCLDMTVAYVRERRQFARPVGSFQALKHRLADLWVSITQARAAARYAAACQSAGDPDTPVAVALAVSACCEAAVAAAQECVQMHGGIGFTWEHPAHLYLKRAKSASIAFGTPDRHRATLAAVARLPGAPAQ
ncbi:MAG TPA: acyl-CoA dehydrogenase family protein [Streptosporangiaceae bacterium]|nr:acyl-CoA dehydrogenase family protein [Streptosporangiaceae bacterium]